MVADDLTDASFLLPVMTRRRTFFEGNVSLMFTLLRPSVAPVDEVQVEPRLVMATLVVWAWTEGFAWDGQGTMHAHFPITI